MQALWACRSHALFVCTEVSDCQTLPTQFGTQRRLVVSSSSTARKRRDWQKTTSVSQSCHTTAVAADPQLMQTVEVSLGTRSYPIYIGQGLLDNSQLLQRHVLGKKVLVVTNETVAPLYLERCASCCSTMYYAALLLLLHICQVSHHLHAFTRSFWPGGKHKSSFISCCKAALNRGTRCNVG